MSRDKPGAVYQAAERHAAMVWSAIAEGADVEASRLVQKFGYARALEIVQNNDLAHAAQKALWRWRARLQDARFESLERYQQHGYTLVLRGEECWPVGLEDLGERRPLCLWVRGDPQILQHRMLGIVGSRDATSSGERAALDLAYQLAGEYLIVSGGAYGIDSQAHRGALLADQPTVIVSAAGVDRVYPKSNAQLFAQCIENGGAVVSESIPGAEPQRFRFLLRNRIIAGISNVLVVVEAGVRSGALNTARHALEIGREVGAYPGSVYSPQHQGTNQLIRNGATLVMNAQHVRELIAPIGAQLHTGAALEYDGGFTLPLENEFDLLTDRIYDVLSKIHFESVETISRRVGLDVVSVRMKLSRLALAGKVAQREGKWRKA